MRNIVLLVVLALLCAQALLVQHAYAETEGESTSDLNTEQDNIQFQIKAGTQVKTTVFQRNGEAVRGEHTQKKIDDDVQGGSTIILDNLNGLRTQAVDPNEAKKKEMRFQEALKKSSEAEQKAFLRFQQIKQSKSEEDNKNKEAKRAQRIYERSLERQKRKEQRSRHDFQREQDVKNAINFKGTCTLASTCPPDWKNRGVAGVLIHKSHFREAPFKTGVDFGKEWTWMHPLLCCATNKKAVIDSLFVFRRKCPTGTVTKGLTGFTLHRKDYQNNPFHNGGAFNANWRWIHPYACQAPSSSTIKHRRPCLLARSCNESRGWKTVGRAGILMHNESIRTQPFKTGKKFNHSWTWAHPVLCCYHAAADAAGSAVAEKDDDDNDQEDGDQEKE